MYIRYKYLYMYTPTHILYNPKGVYTRLKPIISPYRYYIIPVIYTF